jgi:hypothetical protein
MPKVLDGRAILIHLGLSRERNFFVVLGYFSRSGHSTLAHKVEHVERFTLPLFFPALEVDRIHIGKRCFWSFATNLCWPRCAVPKSFAQLPPISRSENT